MKNLNKCDLCESTNLEFVDVVHDYNRGFKGNFNLYKCKNCKLMFLNPQLNVEECLKYYPDAYYRKNDEGTGVTTDCKKFYIFSAKILCQKPKYF